MPAEGREMMGAVLPGNSAVDLRTFDILVPGHGGVLIRTKAVTICGSDIRCTYREHTGKGPEWSAGADRRATGGDGRAR